MSSTKDKMGRPIVVVTGLGVVTSLGAGKTDNWAKLTAGESGIRAITRFPTDGLKTRIAGTIDYLPPQPCAAALTECFGIDRAVGAHAERGIRLAAPDRLDAELNRAGARGAGGGQRDRRALCAEFFRQMVGHRSQQKALMIGRKLRARAQQVAVCRLVIGAG